MRFLLRCVSSVRVIGRSLSRYLYNSCLIFTGESRLTEIDALGVVSQNLSDTVFLDICGDSISVETVRFECGVIQ